MRLSPLQSILHLSSHGYSTPGLPQDAIQHSSHYPRNIELPRIARTESIGQFNSCPFQPSFQFSVNKTTFTEIFHTFFFQNSFDH